MTNLTRKQAENIVRTVIASHAGEGLEENLFENSVNQLLFEANGEEQEQTERVNNDD